MSDLKDIEREFERWWYNYGSGLLPNPEHDLEESRKEIAKEAWMDASRIKDKTK